MTGVKKGWIASVKALVNSKQDKKLILKKNKELMAVPNFVKLNSSRE